MIGVQNFRSKCRTVWNDRDDLSWVARRRASVGYLGWLNRGNLGDESMYVAHQEVSPKRLTRLPIQSLGFRLASKASVEALVLGGGTLVGRREWGTRLEKAIEVFEPSRLLTFGVGVEEPQFALSRGLISEKELDRQADLLRSFDRIGVRGPRSLRNLAELGVKSEVLGDPALVLKPRSGERHPATRPRILLSLAEVGDGYERNADRMRREVAMAARMLAGAVGGDLLGLAMEPVDVRALRRADSALPIVHLRRGVESVIDEISGSTLVISERLHPNIIAAALGTKFVAIGYKPKTYDFAESVHAEDHVIDARSASHRTITAFAEAILEKDDADIRSRVRSLGKNFCDVVQAELK